MSGQDLRKIMNLMESAESKGEYYVDSEGDDHHVFHTDKGEGKAYGTHASKEAAQKDADTRNGKVDESVELDESMFEADQLEGMLWTIYNLGRNNNEEQAEKSIRRLCGLMAGKSGVTEEAILETGNANAQQKGINFDGTPSNKNKGDMDQSSPKSKGPGSKSALAQAVAGTKVGQIKS